jgi:hypothetical protein
LGQMKNALIECVSTGRIVCWRVASKKVRSLESSSAGEFVL